MTRIAVAVLLAVASVNAADTPAKTAAPPKPLSVETKLAIREAQLRMERLGSVVARATDNLKQLEAAFQGLVTDAVQNAVGDADVREYALDENLNVVPAPKPAEVAKAEK